MLIPAAAPVRAVAATDSATRIDSLTGARALAALLVVATHTAFGTGNESAAHGYMGLAWSRLEVGVPIFFVLSGFLLFRPWVKVAGTGRPAPPLRTYAEKRLRRIMPAYVVAVLFAFVVYQFRSADPSPGHTWAGLVRYLTLTQIYTDNFLVDYFHQGLSQMWSLATEAAFYVALPALAYLLLVVWCRGQWKPGVVLTGLAALASVGPAWLVVLNATDWLPNSAGMWLPAHLPYFAGGMALAVMQRQGVRCPAFVTIPLAATCFLIVATPLAGDVPLEPVTLSQPLAKLVLYALISVLVVAPLALGVCGGYARLLSSRPMVWLGEISYEVFLLHVVLMDIATRSVLHLPMFTGSMSEVFVVTMAMTIPLAWILHEMTSSSRLRALFGRSRFRHQTVDRTAVWVHS